MLEIFFLLLAFQIIFVPLQQRKLKPFAKKKLGKDIFGPFFGLPSEKNQKTEKTEKSSTLSENGMLSISSNF